MKKITNRIGVLGIVFVSMLLSVPVFAGSDSQSVSTDALMTKMNRIEKKQDEILQQLSEIQEELRIVKVRVTLKN